MRIFFSCTINGFADFFPRAVYLNIPFLIIVNVLASLAGLVIYAHYAVKKCDPLASKAITSANQVTSFEFNFSVV